MPDASASALTNGGCDPFAQSDAAPPLMSESRHKKMILPTSTSQTQEVVNKQTPRFIVVPMYGPVGLGNQWISLQLATVLAYLTERTLVLDLDGGFQPSGKMMFAHSGSNKHSDLQITDMFNVPVPMLICRQKGELEAWLEKQSSAYTPTHWPSCFLDATIQVGKVEPPAAFKHRRTKHMLHMSDLTSREETVIRMRRWVRGQDRSTFYFSQANTLFYHEDEAVRAEIARVVASIQPRPEFLKVAETAVTTAAKNIRVFDAIHLRRGDLKLSYILNATSTQLAARIREVFGDDDTIPIAVCTDAPRSPIVQELFSKFPLGRLVLCDDWLQPVTAQSDMVTHAFVCLLMCSFARNFLGTPGSTFTNLIQHRRAIHGGDTRIDFVYKHKDPPFREWSWSPRGHPHEIGWFSVPAEDWSLLKEVTSCDDTSQTTLLPLRERIPITKNGQAEPPFIAATSFEDSRPARTDLRDRTVQTLPTPPKLDPPAKYVQLKHLTKSHNAWPPMNGDPVACKDCERLLQVFGVDCIIETGSLYGDTAKWFAETKSDRPVFTIEVSRENVAIARRTLIGCKNAMVLQGSSADVLAANLPQWMRLYKRPLFYLDAHWQNHVLLHKELEAIAHSCYDQCILVIDDVQVPDKPDLRFDSDGDEAKTWDMMRSSVLACFSPKNCARFYSGNMVGKIYIMPHHLMLKSTGWDLGDCGGDITVTWNQQTAFNLCS